MSFHQHKYRWVYFRNDSNQRPTGVPNDGEVKTMFTKLNPLMKFTWNLLRHWLLHPASESCQGSIRRSVQTPLLTDAVVSCIYAAYSNVFFSFWPKRLRLPAATLFTSTNQTRPITTIYSIKQCYWNLPRLQVLYTF